MNIDPAAKKIIKHLDNDDVKVHPERFKHTFMQWLEDLRPRCISRQLWRWHRIPVRYDEEGKKYVFDEDTVLTQTKGKKIALSHIIFNLIADSRLANPFNLEQLIEVLLSPSMVNHQESIGYAYIKMYREKFAKKKMTMNEIDELEMLLDGVLGEFKQKKRMNDKIVAWAEKLVDILEKSAHISQKGDTYMFEFIPGQDVVLTQDEDVLDTWFSSWLRPFSILWWPESSNDLKKFYPNTVLETWYDIIFFRVIRMMIMWVENTDQMPFEHVYLHGLVKDKHGKKMSKSVGNSIDPLELIEEYGADALRWAMLAGNTPGTDMKFDETKVKYMSKFINKLWNASRFVLQNEEVQKFKKLDYDKLWETLNKKTKKMNAYDRWIFSKTQDLIRQVDRFNEKFMLGEALQDSITVVWHDFCDRYIEISKIETSEITSKLLVYCLGTYLKVLHSSLPFVTEKLRNLIGFEWSLMMTKRPKDYEIKDKDYRMNLVMDMISQWRKLKRKVTNKPHEQVDIFVQANKDIQELVGEHFSLIQDIVKVKEVHYLDASETAEWDREVAMIMDIKVWLKWIKEVNKKELLIELEKQLSQEQQFLQNLRTILTGDFASKAPPKVVEQKKLKLDEMKAKVANIEGEIRRLKMEKA